ncbi:hypothetical protein [Morganella morganii]|uniref:hypothetical protein n=1 Tax=Morganella morganii TaxID=582 RepID=UPI002362049D|nr:hypothetical protein [Morganella morganii]
MTTFDKITRLLDSRGVSFEVIEHPAEGRSDAISKIRGNKLSQAAKAMVLQVTGSTPEIRYVLAIVPGDCKVNFKHIVKLAGGKKSLVCRAGNSTGTDRLPDGSGSAVQL